MSKMSQKRVFSISNEHNRIIRYRKASPSGSRVKSGILERHTYKSDSGELLPSTSYDVNKNGRESSLSIRSNISDLTSTNLTQKDPLSFRIPSGKPENILFKNKTYSKGNVRTEHCDSTTDVDVIKNINMESVSNSDSEDYYLRMCQSDDNSSVSKSLKEEDSDSDCQIIEVSKDDESEVAKKKAILKQKILKSAKSNQILKWMIISGKNNKVQYSSDTVHVISDSDSEESVPCVQINRLTSSFSDNSEMNSIKTDVQPNLRPLQKISDSEDINDCKTDKSHLEPSVYEISDGIKVVLPSKQTDINPERSVINNKILLSPKRDQLKRSSSFDEIKPCYESDTAVSSSENLDKNECEKLHLTIPSSSKYQKDLTLSPESMKSEFYSYLKINTNPSAQKAETIIQNRRSVRVRNLIVQNEKLKELNDLKNEDEQKIQKLNEVRKKFLKYSKAKVQFPKPLLEHNHLLDFDFVIEKYFNDEGIDVNKKDLPLTLSKSKNNLDLKEKSMNSYKRKLMYKKIFMKPTYKNENRKLIQKNKENVFFKRKNILRSKIKKHKTNRILRNRRVTRHSLVLDDYKNISKKILRSPKNKIKPVRKKDERNLKTNEENETKNPTPEIDLEILGLTTLKDTILDTPTNSIENLSLSPQDKFDLITKNYLENSIYQNEYRDTPRDEAPSTPTTSEPEEICNSPLENCLGFQPDRNLEEIRKKLTLNIENIILKMNSVQQLTDDKSLLCPTKSFTPLSSDDESHDCEINTYFENKSPEHSISPEVFNSESIKCDTKNYIPLNPNIKTKSFHQSLLHTPSKRKSNGSDCKSDPLYAITSMFSPSDTSESDSDTEKSVKKKSRTHEIDINKNNGPVFNAYYVNCTLIIVQELVISFWKQTPLGNILGAQNMWYSIGNIKRIMLERGCINRRSSEMVLNVDSSVAYIELWTKEHQSDFRERPVADVFATVYFHRGVGSPDKKVLQLENIKGYGKDVRFAVMKNSKEIIVSWYDTYSKPAKTIIRSYQLAADFQTISSTKEMESVEDYLLSLHNIGNCDTLILGVGTDQIFVWNLAHGWLSTTVNFTVEPPLQIHSMCLWAHCETGYLFLLQQIGSGMLRLIAINGVSSQWKQLQIYPVPKCYENLLGVTIESGVLMTCYTNGFLCYDMQSGELLADTETPINRIILPSEKFLVSIYNYQVTVKHVMAYVLEN